MESLLEIFALNYGTIAAAVIIAMLSSAAVNRIVSRKKRVFARPNNGTMTAPGHQGVSHRDEEILDSFPWAPYSGLPPAYQASVEAAVVEAILQQTCDTSSKDPTVLPIRARSLLDDSEFCSVLLDCWEGGCFQRLRDHDALKPVEQSTPLVAVRAAPASAASHLVDGPKGNYLSIKGSLVGSRAQTVTINQVCNLDNEDSKISEWLSQSNYRVIHDEIRRRRMEDTGTWFLGQPTVRSWKAAPGSRVLWCPGIPGVGKTVLASLVVDHLQQTHSDSTPVLFLYFSYKFGGQQNLTTTIEALARQMHEFCCDAKKASPFTTLHAQLKGGSKPTTTELRIQLSRVVEHSEQCWIVIDALDEYLESYTDSAVSTLLETLMDLGSNIKLFVTSRVVGSMHEIFDTFGALKQEIKSNKNDTDTYLKKRISSGDLRFELTDSLAEEITETIYNAARGRFLMVELHMNFLQRCRNRGELREALRDLPHQIDATYARIMEHIEKYSEEDRDLALKTLMWLTCSVKPLRLTELQHALATKPGRDVLEDYITPFATISSLCAGLVVVESGLVSFVHYTASEHFKTSRNLYFAEGDQCLSQTCIEYLSLPCVYNDVQARLGGVNDMEDVVELLFGDPSLYNYASLYWAHHAFMGGSSTLTKILVMVNQMGPAIDSYTSYITQLLDFHIDFLLPCGANTLDTGSIPILLAVYTGNVPMLSAFLQDTTTLPMTHSISPLILADRMRNAAVMQLLSDWLAEKLATAPSSASQAIPPMIDKTIVLLSAKRGHLHLLEILLRYGEVTMHAADDNGNMPFILAAAGGHEEAMSLLLESGVANIDCKNLIEQTAIFPAAYWGREGAVKFLLQKGIAYDEQDSNGNTPFMLAAQQGHTAVMQILLEYGKIHVNTQSKDGRTALSHATYLGREASVRLLLREKNTNINVPNNRGISPLMIAALEGRDNILMLLLCHRDSEVNAQSYDGSSCLSYAIQHKRHSTTKILLDVHHLDVNLQGTGGRSPLITATQNGSTSSVRLLLSHRNLSVNLRDITGRTALCYACRSGQESMVQLLLHHPSIDVNMKDNHGSTPLSLAAERGYESIVRLLLSHGEVDLNDRDNDGDTLLSCLAMAGHYLILECLLEHAKFTIDVNSQDNEGRTPLSWAASAQSSRWRGSTKSERSSYKAVQLLLMHEDLNVNLGDYTGRRPLQYAIESQFNTVIELLRAKGAIC